MGTLWLWKVVSCWI